MKKDTKKPAPKEAQIKSNLAWATPQKYLGIYFLRSSSDFFQISRSNSLFR
jgi:hypothetical protein